MSCLTNAIYGSCDLWNAFNKQAAYNIRQDKTLSMIEDSHKKVKNLWQIFGELKENDFEKKFKQYNLHKKN